MERVKVEAYMNDHDGMRLDFCSVLFMPTL